MTFKRWVIKAVRENKYFYYPDRHSCWWSTTEYAKCFDSKTSAELALFFYKKDRLSFGYTDPKVVEVTITVEESE